jgi:hypothetical protein
MLAAGIDDRDPDSIAGEARARGTDDASHQVNPTSASPFPLGD